jgi:protoporphyrinogen/coproporphyrinogen III oxidase
LSDPTTPRVAVLGGGITGLSAAYHLAQARSAGPPLEEWLIEGAPRLGGVVQTEAVNGFIVEAGPDSFLAEKPEAAALCRALGLGESLLGSNDHQRRTYILHRGILRHSRLVPLPSGLMLFVPAPSWQLLTTPLLPLSSKLAIAADWLRKPASHAAPGPCVNAGAATSELAGFSSQDADESVADFVTRHFGKEMLENIADPLLAGVFGGDSSRLSVRSVLPRFYEIEQRYGSLTRGIAEVTRQRQKGRREAPPLFLTLKEGLGNLTRTLAARLETSRVHLSQRVISIERGKSNQSGLAPGACSYRICCEGGALYQAEAVILALPVHACSRLLRPLDPALASNLASVPHTPAMTVALGYGPGVRERLPRGFGFLVPRRENRPLLACTFVHAKFAHRAPAGCALLRCFLGGAHYPDALDFSDDEVLRLVRRELSQILGLTAKPEFFRIFRWPAAMPQYEVGHAQRLCAIQSRLEHHPGLFVAGNAYSGIGISDCIRTGKAAAERALQMLTGVPSEEARKKVNAELAP